jgi:AraC family transcriptional activator of mtrCDE
MGPEDVRNRPDAPNPICMRKWPLASFGHAASRPCRQRWPEEIMNLDKLLSNLAVKVEPFATCELAAGWRLALPAPPCVLLHFVLKGSGAISGPKEEKRALAPHSLAVVPSGINHVLETGGPITDERSINTVPSDPGVHRIVAGPPEQPDLVVACGMVDVRYGQVLDLFHSLRQILVVDLSAVPKIPELFQEIFAEQHRPVPGSGAMTGALMTQCLLHMFRRLPSDRDRGLPWLISLNDSRLGRAIDVILDDPAYPHTLETLSMEAGMSRSAFSEQFTDMFGRPPINFVQHIRMQRATELLSASSLSVDEIASRVGYSSRSHFAQAFKKHSGISPNAFRARKAEQAVSI